ncbi:ATP phosphoribosyltransferase [Candidatus Micrarchaeota archaeon]|nr:ATP phosphoribosyltransferase [Candidatus Micrarchaeota archaeon]
MIRLAIPNKGRISTEVLRLLSKIGLEVPENGRKLYANTNNPNIQIVYARAADIPFFVSAGVADAGITGEDMILESSEEVSEENAKKSITKLLRLNFGKCKIVVAAPNNSKINSTQDYPAKVRVATKLTNITSRYFRSKKINAKIIRLSGATELAPALGIADLIVDQVSTGTTLAANNLKIVDEIFESEIYLFANSRSLKEKTEDLDSLKTSFESVITAESKRYIMVNADGEDTLARVTAVMPALDSPTILKLAKVGSYAVHSVVDANELIGTICKIKKAGGTGILVMNASRVVE